MMILGYVVFSGENSADEVVLYAQIFASSEDVTDGTEDGSLNVSYNYHLVLIKQLQW